MSAIADAESLPSLRSFLEGEWVVGEPDVVGGLAVFPLSGAWADGSFVSFARAVAGGAEAKELPDRPSVNDIVIGNPTGSMVLLLDGEEVLGAQQNRVFDGSVMAPAGAEVRVAVCCVEKGRWDARGRGRAFRSSAQVSHPGLRGTMARRRDRTTGRTDQSVVWESVERSVVQARAVSVTTAMDDAYRERTPRLDAMVARVSLRDGQRGAVVFVGGRFVALDWVASAEAYADLHARLVRGYAFDAVDAVDARARVPSAGEVERLLGALVNVSLENGGAAGAAQRLRGVWGEGTRGEAQVSALVVGGELAQVSMLAA